VLLSHHLVSFWTLRAKTPCSGQRSSSCMTRLKASWPRRQLNALMTKAVMTARVHTRSQVRVRCVCLVHSRSSLCSGSRLKLVGPSFKERQRGRPLYPMGRARHVHATFSGVLPSDRYQRSFPGLPGGDLRSEAQPS